jgi:hypothetical protein
MNGPAKALTAVAIGIAAGFAIANLSFAAQGTKSKLTSVDGLHSLTYMSKERGAGEPSNLPMLTSLSGMKKGETCARGSRPRKGGARNHEERESCGPN